MAEAEAAHRLAVAGERQEAHDAAASPPFATSWQREQSRWKRILEEVFEQVPAVDDISVLLWDHFGRPESWRSNPSIRRLLAAARAANCEVAVASNFDEGLLLLVRVLPPLVGIEQVFATNELGWRKPAPAFFRAVEARPGRRPEVLLVGDDLRSTWLLLRQQVGVLPMLSCREARWRAATQS